MEQQVLSISQMNHLQELGLDTSKASIWWARIIRPSNVLNKDNEIIVDWYLTLDKANLHTGIDIVETISAFTLQDIIDLLPKAITYNGLIYEFKIQYSNLKKLWQTCYWNYGTFANSFCESESLLDAAYDLLCCASKMDMWRNNKKYDIFCKT